MNITPEQYERLNRFLDAEMTAAEMRAFEQEMELNPELRTQLDFERQVRENLFAPGMTNLPVSPVKKEYTGIGISGKKKVARMIWIAAGLAASVLLVLLLFRPWNNNKPATPPIVKTDTVPPVQKKDTLKPFITAGDNKLLNTDSLFMVFFEKDQIPDEYPPYLADALMAYEQNKFEALEQLDLMPKLRTANASEYEKIKIFGHYYKGVSSLKLGKPSNAKEHFEWVETNAHDEALILKAKWYNILIGLKEGDLNKIAIDLKSLETSNIKNTYKLKIAQLYKILTDK